MYIYKLLLFGMVKDEFFNTQLMLDINAIFRGRRFEEGDLSRALEISPKSSQVTALVLVFAGMLNGCVEVEYDPDTDPFRRHTSAPKQSTEAGGEMGEDAGREAAVNVDAGVDATVVDAGEDAGMDAAREASGTIDSGLVDVGVVEDAKADVMAADVVDSGQVLLDVFVGDAVNDVLVFVDAQKDAPEDVMNTCMVYPAGANGSPTVFNLGLMPEATGPVTAFLAAGVYPAIGDSHSNSWATDGAEFSLTMEPNTWYPGVAVFSGRYSIIYDVGASKSDVYRVNLQKFSEQILDRQCSANDTVCLDLQSEVSNADPDLMTYIFDPENFPVVADMAKCTFKLPGAVDCAHNTVPFLFEGPEVGGSFSAKFPLENRMYVGVMPCP